MEQEIKTYKITSPTGEVRIRVGTSYTECVQELGWPLAESHYEIIESELHHQQPTDAMLIDVLTSKIEMLEHDVNELASKNQVQEDKLVELKKVIAELTYTKADIPDTKWCLNHRLYEDVNNCCKGAI